MSGSIELFSMFVKGNLPKFKRQGRGHVFFCTGVSCRNCVLSKTCKTVPTLTEVEYKQLLVDYPEYMI